MGAKRWATVIPVPPWTWGGGREDNPGAPGWGSNGLGKHGLPGLGSGGGGQASQEEPSRPAINHSPLVPGAKTISRKKGEQDRWRQGAVCSRHVQQQWGLLHKFLPCIVGTAAGRVLWPLGRGCHVWGPLELWKHMLADER